MSSIFVRGLCKIGRIFKRRIKLAYSPLKVAIVGCGGIASTHIVRFESLFAARVDAGSDLSAAMLAEKLDEWPFLRAYRNYRQMLEEVQPDIVSVCTWPQSHSEIVCAAAPRGREGHSVRKTPRLEFVGNRRDDRRLPRQGRQARMRPPVPLSSGIRCGRPARRRR